MNNLTFEQMEIIQGGKELPCIFAIPVLLLNIAVNDVVGVVGGVVKIVECWNN